MFGFLTEALLNTHLLLRKKPLRIDYWISLFNKHRIEACHRLEFQ